MIKIYISKLTVLSFQMYALNVDVSATVSATKSENISLVSKLILLLEKSYPNSF